MKIILSREDICTLLRKDALISSLIPSDQVITDVSVKGYPEEFQITFGEKEVPE